MKGACTYYNKIIHELSIEQLIDKRILQSRENDAVKPHLSYPKSIQRPINSRNEDGTMHGAPAGSSQEFQEHIAVILICI
jgi:hypothetical protein